MATAKGTGYVPFSTAALTSSCLMNREELAMSVVPSMIALIPLPLPPPETLIFTPSFAAMYFSAAAWAMGRTVVEPFMTISAPKAMPDRERIAIPARTAAVFLIAERTSLIFFCLFTGDHLRPMMKV